MEEDVCWDSFLPRPATQCLPIPSETASIQISPEGFYVSLISFVLILYFLVRSKELYSNTFSTGRFLRVLLEHLKFIMIVYLAYEKRRTRLINVLFAIVFPAYNLTIHLSTKTTLPLLAFLRIPSIFDPGCTEILAWNLFLFLSALVLIFVSRDKSKGFEYVTYLNLMVIPATQLAISMGFAEYDTTRSFEQGSLCFATSLQWVFFSIIVPVNLCSSRNDRYSRGDRVYQSDFRPGMKYWLFALQAMQVGLIYCIHLLHILFGKLPGFALCILCTLIYIFRQFQTTYWPYQFRILNFIADDTYLGLLFMCVWVKFRNEYLVWVAFLLPLRQLWRLHNVE